MAKVNLGIMVEVNSRNNQGWKLGTEANKVTDADLHKAVVLNPAQEGAMKLAADGEEIRGFIESIEPHTADGLTFGTVVVHAPGVRMHVTGTGLIVGDMVVAAAQTAAGVANAALNNPLDSRGTTPVKKATTATTFKWQVIRKIKEDLFLIEAV